MVKFGLLFVACCFASINALLAINMHLDSENISADLRQATGKTSLKEVQSKCTPGKFYNMGCKRCFCDDKRRPVCGFEDCELIKLAGYPKKSSFIHSYSPSELLKLPSLPHQSSNCTPGGTYRVDCDTCICLANKNLLCNDLLCPSHEWVNKVLAKAFTGQNCTPWQDKVLECIKCVCNNRVLKCEAEPDCIPTDDGRRDLHKHPPIDLSVKTEKRQCTKGMVYKRDCNRCYCMQDNSLRCTLMKCLKHTEVQRLKKLRTELERDGL